MPTERFWAKVDRNGPVMPHMDTPCWPWTAGCGPNGYGLFYPDLPDSRRRVMAHRFAWALTNGPIPHGLLACHHCDNPPCCNPLHIFLGTHADNTADMMAKGRHWNPPRDGERNGNSKLTDAQRAEIIATFHLGGVTKAALARRYGVSDVRVSQLVLRAESG